MKVAIIGAGNVGKALGQSISRAGHDVTIAAKHPESARAAAQDIGAEAASSPAEAVTDADVVVLAVPYVGAADEVSGEIRDRVVGKAVVDVTNPMKPDYSGLATDGTSAAEEFQKRLPEASVVKAFNTIFATNQANPRPEIDGFVAGDDDKAKQLVISLVESMGFNPVDVGPLRAARYLEGMAVINIGLNAQNGWDWTSAWKLER
jgi:8-hydroxy-5-deazaflavin:NADPH oxidoreductase